MAFLGFTVLITLSAMINPLVIVVSIVSGLLFRKWLHVIVFVIFAASIITWFSGVDLNAMLFLAYLTATACWTLCAFLIKREVQV